MSRSPDRQQQASFALVVETAQAKLGKVILDHEEMLLLACDEISRTYTYKEEGYK